MKKYAIGDYVRVNAPDDDPRNGQVGKIVEDVSDTPAHKFSAAMIGIDPNSPAYKVEFENEGVIPIPHVWLVPHLTTVN